MSLDLQLLSLPAVKRHVTLGKPASITRFIREQSDHNLIPPSPPRRPPIYDEETGEEMKIPEMTDEEFNEQFGEQVGRAARAQRSVELVAAASESGAGAAVIGGIGKGLQKLLESDGDDFDTLDTFENADQTQRAQANTDVKQSTTTQAQAATQTQAVAQAQAASAP